MKTPFSETHPELAREWSTENEKLASEVTHGSSYRALWVCSQGHSWSTTVKYRVKYGSSCKECSKGKTRAKSGLNDIATTHPDIAKEWADEDKKANDVSAGSEYVAQWQCQQGHLYRKTVYERVRRGVSCPFCSNREVLAGFNDLSTTHPEVAKEWSDPRDISTIIFNLPYVAEWKCSSGHIWYVSVRNRFKSKGAVTGCPYCSGRKAVRGANDLLTTHPLIAQEWKDKKDVQDFSYGSGYKATWECDACQQEYTASIANRAIHGKGCPYCSGRSAIPGISDLKTTHPALAEEWDDDKDISTIGAGSGYKAQWKCSEGHSWKASVCNRAREKRSSRCPMCSAEKSTSIPEMEIMEYVKHLLPSDEIIGSDRSLIHPFEIDIYVPGKNFAIEFNGVYWHSENAGKDKFYHLKKHQMCREKGVRLFTVWEDDYRRNPDLVRSMIAHKLGVSVKSTTYARKTRFCSLSTREGSSFMDENHLQQSHRASKYYGLRSKFDDELIAVMGVKCSKKKGEVEITRFATTNSVPGGFSKLLENVLLEYEKDSVSKFVSYSHNDHSWGEVYKKNGFTMTHSGSPGYFYLVNSQREHRLSYSPKRFRERDDLIFEEGKTERELAELNDLNRIWDSGSTRWEKIL